MADIVVVGGCIVDLVSYASRFPKPGETIAGTKFAKGFGGKGANQCVMASRLGASTAMIAKLGEDTFGKEYLQSFKESSTMSNHVTLDKDSHTSTAAICVTEEGQNSIVYVPGAVMKLSIQDIQAAEETIRRAKILLCTFECPLGTLMEALKLAKRHKVKTVVNAAPTSEAKGYECIFPLTDVVCLNEVEAEEMSGVPVTNVDGAAEAIKVLLSKNCSTVILTLGSNGVVFQSKGQDVYTHVPTRVVKCVDSTGAGDAFMGSLVYYMSAFQTLTFQEMIRRACEIATVSVLGHGTQTSFPFKKDLPDWLFHMS